MAALVPQAVPAQEAGFFVSGRVILDDGSALPERAIVERVCDGVATREGYTDAKGFFSLELRSAPTLGMASPDADEHGAGAGFKRFKTSQNQFLYGHERAFLKDLNGCELRAKLPGYRSESVRLQLRTTVEGLAIGTILLHRDDSGEESTTSLNSLKAPQQARKALEKGRALEREGKPDRAIAAYRRAIELYPEYAAAWSELGSVEESRGDMDSARASFQRAIRADAQFAEPCVRLARLELRDRRFPAVIEMSAHAVRLDRSSYPQAFLYGALAHYALSAFETAEKYAREVERLDPRHELPQAAQLLGMLLARRHDYTAAAEQFRLYLKYAPEAPNATEARTQLAEVEDLARRSAQQH